MKIIGASIILFYITNLSFAYLPYSCEKNSNGPCRIFMTPEEDAFKELLLPMMDPFTQISVIFGITGYENNPKTILGNVNEDIKEVNQNTMKNLTKSLGLTYKNPTQVELVAGLDNNYFLPDDIDSNKIVESSIRSFFSNKRRF